MAPKISNGRTAKISSSIIVGMPSDGVKGDNKPIANSNIAKTFAGAMYVFLPFILFV